MVPALLALLSPCQTLLVVFVVTHLDPSQALGGRGALIPVSPKEISRVQFTRTYSIRFYWGRPGNLNFSKLPRRTLRFAEV